MRKVRTDRFRSVWQSILLAVLLCAQTGLLAHQVEHAPGIDHTPCVACSIGSDLQHGAIDHAHPPVNAGTLQPAYVRHADSLASAEARRATARGPPAIY
ncbi:hypothetical protein [Marinihelvus fidelis]|uniref:hypothetical protein n=1 Tax=Marinihelvus fidelis TaxID=2613842 RepID=UPI00178650C3|nr:hypothetical protein [Marinihelvus fidelis]